MGTHELATVDTFPRNAGGTEGYRPNLPLEGHMRRRVAGVLLAAVAGLGVSATAQADSRDPIRGYRVAATPQNLEKLALAGFDVTEGRRGGGPSRSSAPRRSCRKFAAGENVKVTRVAKGASGKQARARAAQSSPYTGSDAAWTRLDPLRPRGGRRQGAVPRAVRPPGAEVDRQARGDRQDPPRARHRRAEGHARTRSTRATTRGPPCSTTRCSTRASGSRARRAAARSTTSSTTTAPTSRSRGSSTRASCGSSA